jgi:AraC-like DNA-binding protein
VDRARRLLLTGLSIADVSLEAGFADQSHFTRAFKRIVGVTPAAIAPAIPFKTHPTSEHYTVTKHGRLRYPRPPTSSREA